MKKLYEYPEFTRVGMLDSILNARGISTEVRNEDLCSVVNSPFVGIYPELWVVDDGRYEEALEVLEEFGRSLDEAQVAEWRCAGCGELVPGTMDSCWNCGLERP